MGGIWFRLSAPFQDSSVLPVFSASFRSPSVFKIANPPLQRNARYARALSYGVGRHPCFGPKASARISASCSARRASYAALYFGLVGVRRCIHAALVDVQSCQRVRLLLLQVLDPVGIAPSGRRWRLTPSSRGALIERGVKLDSRTRRDVGRRGKLITQNSAWPLRRK